MVEGLKNIDAERAAETRRKNVIGKRGKFVSYAPLVEMKLCVTAPCRPGSQRSISAVVLRITLFV